MSCGYVEILAVEEPASARMALVHQYARECLPFLKSRIAQANARQTLLRASHMSATTGEDMVRAVGENLEMLLRPVVSGAEPPAHLLRPTGSRGGESDVQD